MDLFPDDMCLGSRSKDVGAVGRSRRATTFVGYDEQCDMGSR
uniref:Uncharacterized protein n=1 Tax=Nelumbo nucifera TaxID=4432 RepID=A0A822XVJ2_NELNU|nr:TPA_asm: hypothetical protein HUJ06_027064 [Nelumbo nucifera]DAD25654.1 TPA_asm: hypothetical protein HUJ06_027118 [Nelumbo nucifera]